MGMWAVLLLFDHALGLRRSCSEEWFWRGGGGVLALILGVPCSPLSRLISSRRRWISAWAARRSALTSSSRLRSEEHTSELQSQSNLVCRLLLEKKKHDDGTAGSPAGGNAETVGDREGQHQQAARCVENGRCADGRADRARRSQERPGAVSAAARRAEPQLAPED